MIILSDGFITSVCRYVYVWDTARQPDRNLPTTCKGAMSSVPDVVLAGHTEKAEYVYYYPL